MKAAFGLRAAAGFAATAFGAAFAGAAFLAAGFAAAFFAGAAAGVFLAVAIFGASLTNTMGNCAIDRTAYIGGLLLLLQVFFDVFYTDAGEKYR
jgi:hypothetical protein